MALTAAAPRTSDEQPDLAYYPQAAVKAYQGGIAVLNAAGYVEPGTAATGKAVVGIFDFTGEVVEGYQDNSAGQAGDMNARVRRGVFCFANKSDDLVVQADVEAFCYIADDTTVCHTSTSKSVAGIVRRVDSSGVWVHIGPAFGTALASEITTRQALDTDLKSSTGTTLAGVLTGTQVANTADANVVGGLYVVHRIAVADGATGDVDVVLTHKTMITDVTVIKTAGAGGASDTITVKNGSTAITDAMSINVADKVVVRAGTIDDAQQTVAAGGTLKITRTKASAANVACIVVVRGLRVA